MSTSFLLFVNIAAATYQRTSKCGAFAPRPSDRRGAQLIVGAALRITNRLHLVDRMLIMHAYFVNNKETTWEHAGLSGMRIPPARR